MKTYDMSHGSPYDRGSADKYYNRPRHPHKYPEGTYRCPEVLLTDPEEIEAYNVGYDEETDSKEY